jgi:hypothetical protein
MNIIFQTSPGFNPLTIRTTMIFPGSSAARRKVLQQLAGGVVVVSLPIAVWWKSAVNDRNAILERERTKPTNMSSLIPDRNDLLIQRMQPGDVLLFDRKSVRRDRGRRWLVWQVGPFCVMMTSPSQGLLIMESLII